MSRYTIGDVAERTGFSASALRYYERIGLVEPVARTSTGYRVYDDGSLSRLGFIARAKQLGCSLEEITDLLSVCDGECGPLQRRFHELVTEKIRLADARAVAVAAFAGQLRAAAEQLSTEPVDGPCDAGCACLAAPEAPANADAAGNPVACTLVGGAVAERRAEWQALLAGVRRRVTLDDGRLRVELGDGADVVALARLVVAERRCCPFFSFALTVDDRGAALEVGAPDVAAGAVADLFGRAA